MNLEEPKLSLPITALNGIYAESVATLKNRTLYLVAVPIGNLADISVRALAVLQNVDYIACEDTRTTALLLSHYQVNNSLFSLHAHNEKERIAYLLDLLKEDKKVALVSDAGYPSVSDPGALVVKAVAEQGYAIEVVPGANAALVGLTGSALDPTKFTFLGFLPRKGKERQHYLNLIATSEVTTIVYESPLRVEALLEELMEFGMAKRQVCLARELSKRYETYLRLPLANLLANVQTKAPKGECVLLFAATTNLEQSKQKETENSLNLASLEAKLATLWQAKELSLAECLSRLQTLEPAVGLDVWLSLLINHLSGVKTKLNAQKVAAVFPNYSKHDIYQLLLTLQSVLEE